MCRHACPVSTTEGRETWTPQQKVSRINALRKGNEGWDFASTEALWACTGCRHCTTYCNHGVEPGALLFGARAEATQRGAGHPALADYPDRFRARDARLSRVLREHIPKERFSEDAMVGFWPGCDAIDKDLGGVEAALSLFDQIGADHVRMVDSGQVCGGYPLLAGGFVDMFRWHAGKVAAELKRYKTVIMNLHLSEFLAQSAERLPAPKKKPKVYYHDPCYLARHTGVIEAPRRVLSRVAEVHEFSWSHSDTECCGGSGVLPKTMPDVADAMAKRRLAEIARAGGGTVVTACATCAFMLRRNAPNTVTVKDLPEALADAAITAAKEQAAEEQAAEEQAAEPD